MTTQPETPPGDETKRHYLIYSREHNAWWRPDSAGYAHRTEEAGRYTMEEAQRICSGANVGQHPTDPHEVIAACPDAMRALQAELESQTRNHKKTFAMLNEIGDKQQSRIAELEAELNTIKAQAGDSTEYVLAQVNRELQSKLDAMTQHADTVRRERDWHAEVDMPHLCRQIDDLQAFKDYVHKRLDDAGVPIDPESPHKAAGCRIGGRLDVVLGERDELRAELDGANLQLDSEQQDHARAMVRLTDALKTLYAIRGEDSEIARIINEALPNDG